MPKTDRDGNKVGEKERETTRVEERLTDTGSIAAKWCPLPKKSSQTLLNSVSVELRVFGCLKALRAQRAGVILAGGKLLMNRLYRICQDALYLQRCKHEWCNYQKKKMPSPKNSTTALWRRTFFLSCLLVAIALHLSHTTRSLTALIFSPGLAHMVVR